MWVDFPTQNDLQLEKCDFQVILEHTIIILDLNGGEVTYSKNKPKWRYLGKNPGNVFEPTELTWWGNL